MSLRFHLNAIDVTLGNGCGIQEKNYVELLQESGITSGSFATGIAFCLGIKLLELQSREIV